VLRAYRLTRYHAAGCEIRIGRRAPDALFTHVQSRTGTLLTAWNPFSRRMPDGWNARIQQRLRLRLRRSSVLEAEGSLQRWHEAMLLVGGPPAPAIRLARHFRQRAVLVVRKGVKVRLVLLKHDEVKAELIMP
jgi:Protein of unknown function (DUF3293)